MIMHGTHEQVQHEKADWRGWMRVPFASLMLDSGSAIPQSLRINVWYSVGTEEHAWLPRNPWPDRLRQNYENPADLGWLFFTP